MLTLPSGIPVDDAITRPVWLVTFEFKAFTIRFTSRETTTVGGLEFTAGSITVDGISFDARGHGTARVTVPSYDGAFRQLVNSATWRGYPAKIELAYGEAPLDGHVVTIIDGIMDAAPTVEHSVVMTVITAKRGTEFAPRHFASPPTFNHIPPAGTRITWGASTSTLLPPPPIPPSSSARGPRAVGQAQQRRYRSLLRAADETHK